MTTQILKCFGSNARQISPAVVNLFQANNNVDSLEFQIENYQQDNVNLSTLDPYVICHGAEFIDGLDEVKLTSEVTADGILRVYWDLTIMTLVNPQTITAQLVFKNDEGAVWTSYKMILHCNESLTADEEIVAKYPTILKQMEKRIDDKTDEATQGAVDDITNSVASQVSEAMNAINNLAGDFDAGVIYIPYGEHIAPEYRIENRLYYQYTNAENTKGRFEDYMGNVLVAEGSGGGGGSSLPMFAHLWSDHLYNDASYLRADTFSWHDSAIYKTGYEILLKEYNNEKCVVETENGVTYRRSPNGFRIASADQHDNIRYAFEDTGSAWFYLLDTENGRFKLPREKAELVTNYPSTASVDVAVVGNGMTLGLTTGEQNFGMFSTDNNPNNYLFRLSTYGKQLPTNIGDTPIATSKGVGVTTDPTKSGLEGHGTADLSNIETERVNTEVKKYLYFYVGDYVRPETEVNLGILTELANGQDLEDVVDKIVNGVELNNPYSLLDYKFSEYELNNLSWLRSEGQYNPKAVYPAVYELLLKIYNDVEEKAGVRVKLTSEIFTDYDFVLNTSDETFRLPIKVKGASGKAVVGNGMTLGMTNGEQNFGIYAYNESGTKCYLSQSTDNYGSTVGIRYTSKPTTNNGYIAGVTTEPEYSGIETSDKDLYLYFYVGETVQNANLVNIGRIQEVVATKVDHANLVETTVIVETYVNGTSWYRIWSDGWCEQGGYTGTGNVSISFLKPFKDTTYSLLTGYCSTGASTTNTYINISSISTSGFSLTQANGFSHYWQASGYIW